MIFSYRDFLQHELKLRQSKNVSYTMRSYAKFLNLDSGTLSQILKGKRNLAKKNWLLVAKKLKLSDEEKQIFLQSLWDEQGIAGRNIFFSELNSYLVTSENYVEILTEWEFAAAICLVDIKKIEFNVQNLSKFLGITLKRSHEIFSKLFQYGLLKNVNGNVEKINTHFETTEDVTSRALQVAHINELTMAIEKVKIVDILKREFTSLTFAGNSKDMQKMKKWIREKRKEFEKNFEVKNANQVFQLSIQLFPLSEEVNDET